MPARYGATRIGLRRVGFQPLAQRAGQAVRAGHTQSRQPREGSSLRPCDLPIEQAAGCVICRIGDTLGWSSMRCTALWTQCFVHGKEVFTGVVGKRLRRLRSLLGSAGY